jgi:hypothetical protein
MNSTEGPAAIFFAELLLPLHHANSRRGVVYLDRGQRRQSYWSAVQSRTGGLERLPGSACDAPALLVLLGNYWKARNAVNLPQLLPHLNALHQNLIGVERADEQDGRLTEFVYPLF